MSAVMGTDMRRVMRETAPSISSRLMRSPSGYPRLNAIPALVVARAGKPDSTKMRALPASHALGSTSIGPSMWSRRSAAALLTSSGEAIACLPNRENVLRAGGIALQLAAQLGDVRVDRAAYDLRAVAPDFSQQLSAGDAGAVAPDQRQQQIVLFGCQGNGRAIAQHRPRRREHLDLAEFVERRIRRPPVLFRRDDPSQQCFDAGKQLEHAERLR